MGEIEFPHVFRVFVYKSQVWVPSRLQAAFGELDVTRPRKKCLWVQMALKGGLPRPPGGLGDSYVV